MSRDETAPYSVNGLLAIPRVLVVDADAAAGERRGRLLNESGFKSVVVSDMKAVREKIQATQFDVILCDEVFDSFEDEHLVEFVRRTPATAQVPLVVLTIAPTLVRIRYHQALEPFSFMQKTADDRTFIDAVRRTISVSLLPAHPSEESNSNLRKGIIHTLSHEFRTPLLAINTGVELLLDHRKELGDEKVQTLLEAIKNGGGRLQKLVNDFMTLQQIEVGLAEQAFNNTARDMSVVELLTNFMDSRGYDYQREGAKVIVEDQSGGAHVRVVESQIVDCLDRLVSNAIKFSSAERVAQISVQRESNSLWLHVKDRGIGIDLNSLQEATGIFGQIGRRKFEQQGSGLGLPIANHFAAINGGRLGFQHREGGGSIVSLVLPLVQ
jgi:two-component system sensor histidine kinase/response regulator